MFRLAYNQSRKVRLIGVRLSQLDADVLQMNLFENAEEGKSLFNAIDDIKKNFGKNAISRAGGMADKRHQHLKSGDPLYLSRNAPKKSDEDEPSAQR